LTLVGTLLGMLLAALDQTIVATAGLAIQRDLHIEPALYAWLTMSYLVAAAARGRVARQGRAATGRRRPAVASTASRSASPCSACCWRRSCMSGPCGPALSPHHLNNILIIQ
jgi:MFS family permease